MKCPDANNDSQKSQRIFVEDVASILGVPLRTAQLMASRGELPSAVKIGKRCRSDETPLGGPSGMLVQDQPRC
jgi:hypothetical protein